MLQCLPRKSRAEWRAKECGQKVEHKSWESCFSLMLAGKTKTLPTVDFMQLRLILKICHPVIKSMWMAHYFGSDCQNTSKSLEGWNHTPYYSMHLALSVSSPSHRIKIEEQRWHITSEFSCLELVPRIGRFEWSQWSDMVPLLWINPLIRSLAHERHWFSGLWEYLHWLFSSWLLL